MDAKKTDQLAQLFRGPFLRKVARGNYYKELVERIEPCGLEYLLARPLSEIFEAIYAFLVANYRCEYVYKNILTRNWFLSRHSLVHSYITDEFRIGKHRVDLALFGKTSTAFEIKTEFDTTKRLYSQSREYTSVFDMVYVITSKNFMSKIIEHIPETIGILELHQSGRLITIRSSKSHSHSTNIDSAFNCFRRNEMTAIAESVDEFNAIGIPSSRIYTECKKRLLKLDPVELQNHLVNQLRRRKYSTSSIQLVSEVPDSLKHAALTLRATNIEKNQLRKELRRIPKPSRNRKGADDEKVFSLSSGETERTDCAANTCG